MRLSGFALACGRRAFLILTTAAAVGFATVAYAEQPAAGGQAPAPGQAPAQPAAPPAAPADQFKFTTEAAAILWLVKPEATADFEAVWSAIRARLLGTDKPELKALGESLRFYKWDIPAAADGVTYLFVADPASKTTSYSPSPFLLFNSGLFADQVEARALFDKLAASLTSVNPIGLVKIPAPAPIAPAPAAPAAPAAP